MIYRQAGPVPYYQFVNLAAQKRVKHYVFTRIGGVSRSPFASLNVGHTVGDDDGAVEANHGLVYEATGISEEHVVTAHQVHGTRVATVRRGTGSLHEGTDALVTDRPGLLLMLRFADCVPVMLYDPVHKAVGLIHSGRLGTLECIVARTVDRMGQEYGSRPADLIAGIGPSIGPCCYQVGPEVGVEVKARLPDAGRVLITQTDGSLHLDLWEAIRQQLVSAGVDDIEGSGLCTACHVDEFFSHRAEQGHTGRFAALIGLRPDGKSGKP